MDVINGNTSAKTRKVYVAFTGVENAHERTGGNSAVGMC